MDILRTKSVEHSLEETAEKGRRLKRTLSAWDLAMMGVAVAVGAGIFSVGAQAAAFHAGPAVIISFIIAGVVCAAAALCYAEFASMVPVAGSAYSFTYTTIGEFIAWIIGWDMILEMMMAGAVIAKYWGIYLTDFTKLMGWNISTRIHFGAVTFDWAPAVIVTFFTLLLVLGTHLSSRIDGALTVLKIAIVLFIVIAGFFYIRWSNFIPFIPTQEHLAAGASGAVSGSAVEQPLWQWATHMTPSIYGVPGILSGAALVFFAFIGFDIVATASEEAKDPGRTVPRGIILGVSIVVVMYILVAFVTTGMVSYKRLAAAKDPSLATAFELAGAQWAAKIISFGIVVGLTTVVMVLLLGLSRVVFAMSRDGLLPRGLSKTGKRGTPVLLQISCGVIIAVIASFFDVSILSDMVNIGTLSAFMLVAAAVPIMRRKRPDLHRTFKIPGSPWVPGIVALLCLFMMINLSVLTWLRFLVWLAIGLAVYFGYSYRHSKLNSETANNVGQYK